MISKAYRAWMHAGWDAWALGMEATAVIGLRVARAASGGDADGKEAWLMLTEKMQATWELQAGLLTGKFGTSPLAGTRGTIRHYHRKVTANRKRLSK